MDDLEQKLGAMLNNPQLMQQVISMAQALGQGQTPQQEQKTEIPVQQSLPQPAFSGNDAAMLQRIMGLARQSGIDKNQQNLLRALGPYLSRERISKLEKAMRAARIAGVAATALRSAGAPNYSGR